MDAADLTFDEVMAGAKAGEPWAADHLFRTHQPLLLRYFRAREPGVAEDLAAEVWVGVTRRLREFRGDEVRFRAWLFTIARRQLAGWRRRRIQRPQDAVAGPVSTDLYVEPAGPGEPVADDAIAQQAIARMVAPLSRPQAEVLLLRVVADLPAAAVAELMGRTENWVRVTQHRALRRLAASMAPDGNVILAGRAGGV